MAPAPGQTKWIVYRIIFQNEKDQESDLNRIFFSNKSLMLLFDLKDMSGMYLQAEVGVGAGAEAETNSSVSATLLAGVNVSEQLYLNVVRT